MVLHYLDQQQIMLNASAANSIANRRGLIRFDGVLMSSGAGDGHV